MDTIKVAVTGVGGGAGQSVMKGLFAAQLPIEVYPVDVTPFSAGLYRGRCGGTVLPKPEEDIDTWRKWVQANGIQAIIPGADRDLPPLAAVRDAWFPFCRVLVSRPELIEIGNDKLLTVNALDKLDFPVPYTLKAESALQVGERLLKEFGKLVVKPRSDAASRGVHVVEDMEALRFYVARTPNAIVQEYLEGDEYTCTVFVDKFAEPRASMVMKRSLYAGSTYRAEVIKGWRYEALLNRLGAALRPLGPLNVQLRDVPNRGPVIFELNVRCSGSTAIRTAFGYNEPEMLVKHFLMGKPIFQPPVRAGYAFRYWDEIVVEGADEQAITQGPTGLKGRIPSWL